MTNYNPNDPYNRHGSRHENHTNSHGGKKAFAIIAGVLVVAGVAAASLYMVDVDQTKEARLPNVDVRVTEGQMPAYDVEVADVSLRQKEVEVEVPTMDVETETKTIEIEVPVDVDAGTKTDTVTMPVIDIERPEMGSPDNDKDTDNPTQ